MVRVSWLHPNTVPRRVVLNCRIIRAQIAFMTCRVVGLRRFFVAYFSILVVTFSLVVLLHETSSADQGYLEVDLEDLVVNIEAFQDVKIGAKGTVQFWASFYMYADFWLAVDTQGRHGIPVVVRNAGLSQPSEDASIEVGEP